jgi:hypothetical protein
MQGALKVVVPVAQVAAQAYICGHLGLDLFCHSRDSRRLIASSWGPSRIIIANENQVQWVGSDSGWAVPRATFFVLPKNAKKDLNFQILWLQ